MDVTSGCVACSLMPDKAMTLPMSGRLAPLSPDSLSPHDHIAYHGTGEMGQSFSACGHICGVFVRPSIELSETGRMLSTALSDGYLTMHDESHAHSDLSPHHQQLSMSLDGRHFVLSPDDTLFPPLSHNDRHPSAPQLVSMLTDNKADVMLDEEQVPALCIRLGNLFYIHAYMYMYRAHVV